MFECISEIQLKLSLSLDLEKTDFTKIKVPIISSNDITPFLENNRVTSQVDFN